METMTAELHQGRTNGGRMRFDTGGGYIRGVMAGMKPIANDAGIRDRRAKRELVRGAELAASQPLWHGCNQQRATPK